MFERYPITNPTISKALPSHSGNGGGKNSPGGGRGGFGGRGGGSGNGGGHGNWNAAHDFNKRKWWWWDRDYNTPWRYWNYGYYPWASYPLRNSGLTYYGSDGIFEYYTDLMGNFWRCMIPCYNNVMERVYY